MDWLLFLLPVFTAVLVALLRLTELATKRNLVKGPIKEKKTFNLFLLNGLLVLCVALAEYLIRDKSLSLIPYSVGVILAIISFIIRRKAIESLGKFWSLHVEIRDNHKFVKDGLYRWVRHPAYFSMILELLAGILILNSYIALILVFVFFIPVLLKRVRLEEEALILKFGQEYKDYVKNTPAILPYRIPSDKK